LEKNFLLNRDPALNNVPEVYRDMIQALESIPVTVSVSDLQGSILYVNERSLRALGYSADELRGRHISILYGPSLTEEEVEAMMQETIAHGWRGEVLNYRKDGSSFPVFVETGVLRDAEGAPGLLVAVARDISEQRAFQERLLAETKLGTLGLIAHNVAHEVRNHLSTIKMCLYMLEKGRTPDSKDTIHFSIAQEEVDRVERFLRTLESYVNPPKPTFTTCDLIEVVNKGLEDARRMLVLKSVALYRQFPSTSPRVLLDRHQFAQAVTHAVQNATEAMDRGGELHVVIKRQPDPARTWWLVEIRDNGPGVATHLQNRVFEPFFTTNSRNLGLGLSNIGRILELHGGTATLTSTPGKGTVVTMKVPENGKAEE
jgi:PAS domain S-box-containing protein